MSNQSAFIRFDPWPNTYRDFLCACIRQDRDQVLNAIRQDTWSWESLFQTAAEEALLPILYSQFKSLNLLHEIPQEIPDFLLSVEAANRERNASILAELKAAVTHLNAIGIEPVLLKGAAYLQTGVYQDPAHRFLMDIDILVPEEQQRPATESLTQNGWLTVDLDPFRHFRPHSPALHRASKVWIEIHHALGTGACERVLPAREVIERSAAIDLDGLRVRVPAPADLLTHLVMHSQMQHTSDQRIWTPIRALLDLLRLTRRFAPQLDWQSVAKRFSAAGKYGVFALHLLQLQDSLAQTVPFRIELNPLLRFCRYRRKALQTRPALRYVDPSYMFSMVLAHRLRMARKVLATKTGAQYLLAQILAPENYHHLWADVKQGRNR